MDRQCFAAFGCTAPTPDSLFRVHHQSRPPVAPLDRFVERLWHLNDAPAHAHESILPSGTMELVINLRRDEMRIYDPEDTKRFTRFSGAIVSGTYARPFATDTEQHAAIIGVHFRVGGAFSLLGVDACELADAHVDLETLWGSGARLLRERLCETDSVERRFQLLEQSLMTRVGSVRESHAAVNAALATFTQDPTRPIRDVVREIGLSPRRVIQLFTREIGLPPKLFCRVRRCQRALDLVRQMTEPKWGLLALQCGYFDQSHFIRDFQGFTGFSPVEYLRRQSSAVMLNHVPLTK